MGGRIDHVTVDHKGPICVERKIKFMILTFLSFFTDAIKGVKKKPVGRYGLFRLSLHSTHCGHESPFIRPNFLNFSIYWRSSEVRATFQKHNLDVNSKTCSLYVWMYVYCVCKCFCNFLFKLTFLLQSNIENYIYTYR